MSELSEDVATAATADEQPTSPPVVEVAEPTSLVAPDVRGLGGVTAVVVSEELELSRQLATGETAIIDRLWTMPNAEELMERRAMLIESTHISAIRATNPADWVLFRDKQGVTTAMLRASGANHVHTYYAIDFVCRPIKNGRFDPVIQRDEETNEVRATCWFDAVSKITGRSVMGRAFSRSDSEQFIGRGGQNSTSALVAESDLKNSTFTGAYTAAARIIGGMTRLDASMLEKCWEGTAKSLDKCSRGSGFGTASGRSAQQVASPEAQKGAEDLWAEILRRVGGDHDAGRNLTKEITANPQKGFQGFDDYKRLTQDWQIKKAWQNLENHAVFGGPEGGGK